MADDVQSMRPGVMATNEVDGCLRNQRWKENTAGGLQ